MFEIKGKIEFDPQNVTKKHNKQSSWKRTVVVRFDCDTYAYYAWLLERRFGIKLNKPIRGTHITIISDIVDNEIYEQARQIFNGKELVFQYDPTYIRSNGSHWWIKAYCEDVKNIRVAMGLNQDPYFGLHLTIGIATHLQEEQSKYIVEMCKKFNL